MNGADINPNWGKETAIEFSVKADNFVYDVAPPLSDIENRALIASGLMLGASVDGSGIDPDGECITEPFAMENYGSNESGESIPVSSSLRLAGESIPEQRVRDLQRIAGALGVMRGTNVDIDFDREAKIASGYLRVPEDEENGEDHNTPDISADFDAYAREQIARFNGLSDFFTDSVALVSNLERSNAALTTAGRPDLVMTKQIEMAKVDSPEEIFDICNNFCMNFLMYTDRIEPPEGSHALAELIPITKEQLDALKDFPKVGSYEENKEIEQSGDFVLPFQSQHFSKPAFLRMLILFPDFTKDLVTRMSAPEKRGEELTFKPELFVAWQLMSRLVDENDIYVKERATTDMPYATSS